MIKKLKLSDTLALPRDAITQTFGVLAVRGAGKSNVAAVMAEEMFAAKLPFVVIDPVGSWFGLRSSGDGKGKGIAIPIFGGRHGDVPLEKTGGSLIADLVVDQRMTCVLDTSELSEGDKIRFLIDFAERLYRKNTEPLHLFLEEADDFIPQRPFREQARLLGAWENIVRRGRARGLGMTMITQRSAAINKNVLTQVETLIVLRTTSPQDRAAIEAWCKYQGGGAEMLATLPSLDTGEAWVWSPSWLKTFRRVRIRRRWTFDSGATPKTTRGAKPTATLADVDLGAIKLAMADTIERSKAEDPKAMRAEIAVQRKLVAALHKQITDRVEPKPEIQRVEVPVVSQAKVDALKDALVRLDSSLADVSAAVTGIKSTIRDAENLARLASGAARQPAQLPTTRRVQPVAAGRASSSTPYGPGGELPKGELAVLKAVAQYADEGADREQVSILTGYKRSTRDAYLQRLRERGLVSERGAFIVATQDGLTALGSDFEPLPTGDALRVYWDGRLPEGERKILEVLCSKYPKAVDREALGDVTGYKRSTRDAYIQRLGTRKLVSIERDGVTARSELFD